MISVKLLFTDEDRTGYAALLKERFPNATETAIDAQIDALISSKTLLTNAIYHLTFYYVIGCKEVVAQLKQEKSRFWLYTLEALYNSGVMFLCGLLDDDKKLGYKNICTIERNFTMLKNTSIQLAHMPHQTEKVYGRLKNLRDKRLAHYEYSKDITPQYYDDPAILCNIIYKYLQSNERIIFNAIYDTGTLSNFIHSKANGICQDIGVRPLSKKTLGEIVSYIETLGSDEQLTKDD